MEKLKIVRIGKEAAKNIAENLKGKFATYTFATKTKPTRVLNGIYKKTSPLGYLHIKERGVDGLKAVNLQTLKEIKANGLIYKVK